MSVFRLIARTSDVTDHVLHFGNHIRISSSTMGTIVGTTDRFGESKAIQATDIGSDCREYGIRRFIDFCTSCEPADDGLCDRALVAIGYPSSHVSN
jgi:hypothetical protein